MTDKQAARDGCRTSIVFDGACLSRRAERCGFGEGGAGKGSKIRYLRTFSGLRGSGEEDPLLCSGTVEGERQSAEGSGKRGN